MKNVLMLLAAAGLCASAATASVKTGPMPAAADTIIVIDNRQIEVNDNGDRLKVKVYDITQEGDTLDRELVFEGHYRDGQSYERRRHLQSINIPVPTWKKDGFSPHWVGFGMGFCNVADGSLHVNDINGVSLRSGKSLEYNLNFMEMDFPFSHYNWAVVTGMGIRWNRYRLDTNQYFKEVDGVTVLLPAPDGVTYTASRLNTTSLTIPLLLEWQKRKKNECQYFFSAGVVGVIKTTSSSKVTYVDEQKGKSRVDKMDGGMNLRPVSVDFLVQAGYRWIGAYAKYSPMTLFGKGKGPELHPVSIGLQLHF